jgi:hypothetical protein
MHEPACLHVFSYAERESGRYLYRRIGSTMRPEEVTDLWVSLRLGESEQALAGGKDHAYGRGADARNAWAFATHVAEARLADGRRQRFTHLVVTGAPFDSRLLEYALLRRYESGAALSEFGNGVLASAGDEIDSRLKGAAATIDEVFATDGAPPPRAPEWEPRTTQPAKREVLSTAARTSPVPLAWHAYVVVFLLSAAGAATSTAAVRVLEHSPLLRNVLELVHQ